MDKTDVLGMAIDCLNHGREFLVMIPDAATIMSVLLIRMLKYSGCFCKRSSGDGKKLVIAVVFADDSTLLVTGGTNFEVQQRA